MIDKITVLFLTDRNKDWQSEKAKLMMKSFINTDEILAYKETKELIEFDTKTHNVRIVKLHQSPRGYRANFIFDLTGFQECLDTESCKSTYNWNGMHERLDEVLKENGWGTE